MSKALLGRSLFVRLSVALLAALVVLGVLQFLIFYRYFKKMSYESVQRANWSLAAAIGRSLADALKHPPDAERLQILLYGLSQSHPSTDVYLIDGSGAIRSSFIDPGGLPAQSVDMEPIRRFLANPPLRSLPILGDDPQKPGLEHRKPFSAAPAKIGNVDGFLYVVLHGMRSELISSSLEQDYGLRTLVLGLLVAVGATAAAGTGLFFHLTRRIRSMQQVLERFRSGDYGVRIPDGGFDDLAEIARSFNEMASTVEAAIHKQALTDEQRRRFVASISHDLRSPLTYVRGNIETLLMDRVPPSEHKSHLESSRRGVLSLESLIDNLFELSKLEANEALPNLESVPLTELLNHVIGRVSSMASSRSIRIERYFSETPAVVVGDPMMLERIFVNLIENAVKYGKDGGVVRIRIQVKGTSVRCAVEDDGIGMAEDAMANLFTPFYRIEEGKNKSQGSGLGLALTKRLLEAQGSTIHVQSRPGEGSTFYFELSLSE